MATNDKEAVTTPTGDEGENDEEQDTATAPDQVKSVESDEAKLSRFKRMTAQLEKRLGKTSEENREAPANTKDSSLDYGQKAFLVASGIKGSDEMALVQTIAGETGKTIEAVIASKYFQAELKELRDNASAINATPTGTKRSTASARDSVEYWIAKGELPPASETKLRRDVVNAKIKARTSESPFTKHPVA